MEEFSRSLNSLSWWIGVVVVGIILNLLSAYLKGPLDKLMSFFSSKWRDRNDESRRNSQLYISELIQSSEARAICWQREVRRRLQSLAMLIVSLIFLALSIYIQLRVSQFDPAGLSAIQKLMPRALYFLSLLITMLAASMQFTAIALAEQLRKAQLEGKT
jgi:hypothetical protein